MLLPIGIDLGARDCRVAAPNRDGHVDVLPNAIGNRRTPSVVAFAGPRRVLGDAATEQRGSNAANTIDNLLALLAGDVADDALRFALFDVDAATARVRVAYHLRGSETALLAPEQLLAPLLHELAAGAVARARSMADPAGAAQPSSSSQLLADVRAVIALVPSATPRLVRAVADAARIAGGPHLLLHIVPSTAAVARAYAHRLRTAAAAAADAGGRGVDAAPRTVLFVDMGFAQCSAAVYRFDTAATGAGMRELATVADAGLGTGRIDRRLFDHSAEHIRQRYGVTVAPASRRGARLLAQCERIVEQLSANPAAQVTLEAFADERDVTLAVTRDAFVALCAAEQAAVTALVRRALARAGGDAPLDAASIAAVELVGGGTRIPFVQAAVQEVFGAAEVLRNSLDCAASCAIGAGLLAQAAIENPAEVLPTLAASPTGLDDDTIARYAADELAMQAQDRALQAAADARNALETFIFETRGAMQHGQRHYKLWCREPVELLLADAEHWLRDGDDEGLVRSAEQLSAKLERLREQVREASPQYYQRLADEAQAAQVEQRRVAEQWTRERAEQAASGHMADHDRRALPKAERMELLMRSKEEGSELFRRGAYDPAIVRYTRALQHADKFTDLTDAERSDVRQLRAALHVNLAACYAKLARWQQCVDACQTALSLTPDSTKALYRRATAYAELGDWDKADADIGAALAREPNDPALQAFSTRVKAKIAERQAAEKSTYQRMFQ